MNGAMTDWLIGFASVMEIVAVVLPVCGLSMIAVIMLAPRVGNLRVTLPRREAGAAEMADATLVSALPRCAASSGCDTTNHIGCQRPTATQAVAGLPAGRAAIHRTLLVPSGVAIGAMRVYSN